MPPCAAADELHGLNRETAELNAGTLSTTVFDRRNSSCPRRQNLARLGGDEPLRHQCAAKTTGRSAHISHSFLQSIRDITPEFSGRTMSYGMSAACPGPAATRCYIAVA
jgi:hypothetical protein